MSRETNNNDDFFLTIHTSLNYFWTDKKYDRKKEKMQMKLKKNNYKGDNKEKIEEKLSKR